MEFHISLVIIAALMLEVFSHSISKLTEHKTQAYLTRYGYIAKKNVPLVQDFKKSWKRSTQVLVNAEKFSERAADIAQKSINLFENASTINETSILDAVTKSQIQKKRCGVSDIASFNLFPHLNKWYKNDITWQFTHHSHQLKINLIRRAVTEAFGVWSAVTPLNFTEVTTAADIKVSFVSKEHGNCPPFDGPGLVLAHATDPNGNPSFVHFDDEEYWVYRDEKKLRQYPYTDLLNVAIHEIGHTLGLGHSSTENAIMNPQYNLPFDKYGRYIGGTLREDDIQRIQKLYGPKNGEELTTKAPFRPHFTTWFWGPWFGSDFPDYS